MICLICDVGDLQIGTGTITLERASTILVVKSVPALVCDNCGEKYFEDDITENLLNIAEEAVRSGVQVEVREYVAA